MDTIWLNYALPCLCAFLACAGFTLVFNIHGGGMLICSLGGAMCWLIYLLAGSTIFAAFLSAAAIGVFSEVMARLPSGGAVAAGSRGRDLLCHELLRGRGYSALFGYPAAYLRDGGGLGSGRHDDRLFVSGSVHASVSSQRQKIERMWRRNCAGRL